MSVQLRTEVLILQCYTLRHTTQLLQLINYIIYIIYVRICK
jgi:hypothetical protein